MDRGVYLGNLYSTGLKLLSKLWGRYVAYSKECSASILSQISRNKQILYKFGGHLLWDIVHSSGLQEYIDYIYLKIFFNEV